MAINNIPHINSTEENSESKRTVSIRNMDTRAWAIAIFRSKQLGITVSQYIEKIILMEATSEQSSSNQ